MCRSLKLKAKETLGDKTMALLQDKSSTAYLDTSRQNANFVIWFYTGVPKSHPHQSYNPNAFPAYSVFFDALRLSIAWYENKSGTSSPQLPARLLNMGLYTYTICAIPRI